MKELIATQDLVQVTNPKKHTLSTVNVSEPPLQIHVLLKMHRSVEGPIPEQTVFAITKRLPPLCD